MNRQEFVSTYSPIAAQLTSGTGIFPEVMLSQAIIESQDGKTGQIPGTILSRAANNYFGIKADPSWKGKTITLKTGEEIAGKKVTINGKFRAYDNPIDSFRDYISFLKSNPTYTKAGVFKATNVQQQASALKAAGYATNSKYAELITNVASSIKKWVQPSNVVAVIIFGVALFFLISNLNSKRNEP